MEGQSYDCPEVRLPNGLRQLFQTAMEGQSYDCPERRKLLPYTLAGIYRNGGAVL